MTYPSHHEGGLPQLPGSPLRGPPGGGTEEAAWGLIWLGTHSGTAAAVWDQAEWSMILASNPSRMGAGEVMHLPYISWKAGQGTELPDLLLNLCVSPPQHATTCCHQCIEPKLEAAQC